MKATILNLILLVTLSSAAQKMQTNTVSATTSDGKTVTLYSNGKWEYAKKSESNLDSITCENLIETTVDKMTGKSTTGTNGFIDIGNSKSGFKVILLISNGTIVFNLEVLGKIGCIDKGNAMNILFRDGTKLELKHASDFNCQSDFTVYLGKQWHNEENIALLATKEIETIRVWGKSTFIESDLTQENSKRLMKAFSCLRDR